MTAALICPFISAGRMCDTGTTARCQKASCAIWDLERNCCGLRACSFVYTQEVRE